MTTPTDTPPGSGPSSAAEPTARATRPGPLIGVVLVASFMELLDVTIVAVAAPDIQRTLGASPAQLQWMVAAYALALGAALITGGRIGDRYGRRRAFLLGLAAFVLASAACALAPSAGALVAMRVVQGLAAGLMVPQVFGIIRSSLTPRQMGAALGAYGGVQGLAAIAGPLVGGVLVNADLGGLGWRTIFWVNVPVGLVALLIARRVIPESRASGSGRLDLLGAGLLAASLVLVLLPVVQGRSWGWPAWGWALLGAGLLGLLAFVLHGRRLARRGGEPVLDPALLRVRAFAGGLLGSVAFFGGISPFFLLLSVYLQDGTGRSALATGLLTLPYALGSLVTSGFGVRLAARHGRRLLVGGSLVVALSHGVLMLVLSGVDASGPTWWQLGIPLFIGGLGLGLAAPPLVGVVLAGVPPQHAGAAGGVLSTVNQVGGAIGVAVLGTLFFGHLADAFGDGAAQPGIAFGDALLAVLPWQLALSLAAAALMLLIPRAGRGARTPAC